MWTTTPPIKPGHYHARNLNGWQSILCLTSTGYWMWGGQVYDEADELPKSSTEWWNISIEYPPQ